MATMDDTGMPVGLTIAGRAYHDVAQLRLAAAFEATGRRRTAPPRAPPIMDGPQGEVVDLAGGLAEVPRENIFKIS
jgi:hypothetical protein